MQPVVMNKVSEIVSQYHSRKDPPMEKTKQRLGKESVIKRLLNRDSTYFLSSCKKILSDDNQKIQKSTENFELASITVIVYTTISHLTPLNRHKMSFPKVWSNILLMSSSGKDTQLKTIAFLSWNLDSLVLFPILFFTVTGLHTCRWWHRKMSSDESWRYPPDHSTIDWWSSSLLLNIALWSWINSLQPQQTRETFFG